MDKKTYYLLLSIMEEIEMTDNLLVKLDAFDEKPLGRDSFVRKRRSLVQELFEEMKKAGLEQAYFAKIYQKMTAYLENDKQQAIPTLEHQQLLKKAEQLFA